MRARNILYIFIILFCFTACKNKTVYSVVDLFNETKELKNHSLRIDGFSENILNPAQIEIINDRLFLLDVQASTPFSVIDLQKQKYLNSFGKKGEGPGEIIGVMDFYVNYNETGINCWDAMLRHLYFCEKDSALLYNKTVGINLFDDLKNKKSFNSFFPNVLQVDKSLFLAIGCSGEKRFSLLNTKNNKVLQTGEYPKQEMVTGIDSTIKAHAYHGKIRYNREKKRVVYISLYSEMIEIFNVNEFGLELAFGNYTTIPKFKQENSPRGIRIRTEKDKFGTNLGVSISDDYIFILYQSKIITDKNRRSAAANDVLVFNWNGEPIMHYKLDHEVTSISIKKDSKRLYALINNEEPEIIYYDLNL